jgi:hypothetical protein
MSPWHRREAPQQGASRRTIALSSLATIVNAPAIALQMSCVPSRAASQCSTGAARGIRDVHSGAATLTQTSTSPTLATAAPKARRKSRG